MNGETRRNKKNRQVLSAMHIVAWVAFIGFMVEAGAMLTGYAVTLINPAAGKLMYKGLDLEQMQVYGFEHYTLSVLFTVGILCTKAFVSLLAIKVLSSVNLSSPFNIRIARLLQKISFILVAAAFIALLAQVHDDWLQEHAGAPQGDHPIGEFLFTAGLVFIISQVFRRGVELQTENELTV